MMQFRVVTAAIQTILADAADIGDGPRYQVVGFQKQGSGEEERKLPTVTVFYREGEFPVGQGSISGPNQHNADYSVQLMVLSASTGDLDALDAGGTPAEMATALSSFDDAAQGADNIFDQLVDDIYQVLMDAQNETFGLAIGAVSSRWVGNIRKDQPIRDGQLVILSGSMRLTCRVEEVVLGLTGTAGTEFDTVVDIDGDDTEQTGAAGTLGG